MKKTNYYLTLTLILFTTLFSFFNMFQIVKVSFQVIHIVFNNLLPSLLPFMILISLCIQLGLIDLLSFIIQYLFCPIFHLTPTMASIYFLSFFCGYPTNAKMIKESYEKKLIDVNEVQHLLSIACFSSISFIFISLSIPFKDSFIIYLSHILPSIFLALFYRHPYTFITITDLKHSFTTQRSITMSLKNSIISSLYAFIFILGYMLVFQFLVYSLSLFIHSSFLLSVLNALLEFSSGCFSILKIHSIFKYPLISFFLSFSGLSVYMQIDNLMENIPYSFLKFFFVRLFHAFLSFFICFFIYYLTL